MKDLLSKWTGWAMLGVLLLFMPSCRSTKATALPFPSAKSGVLDLRSWDFEKQSIVPLSGEWEFFHQKFVSPSTKRNNPSKTTLRVPGNWGSQTLAGKKLQVYNAGTYRLTVLLPPNKNLALRLHRIYSSYKLFLNGKKLVQQGHPSLSKSHAKMRVGPMTVDFHSSRTCVLLLHVSNHSLRKGGITDHIYLGKSSDIYNARTTRVALDVFLFSFLFVMSLYYFIFYILFRRSVAPLLFSMACLSSGLRVLLINESILVSFFDTLPYLPLLRLEYVCTNLFNIFGLAIIREMFPEEVHSKVFLFFVSSWGLLALLSVGTPPEFFTRLFWFQILLIPLGILFVFLIHTLALLHKRPGAGVFLFGFAIASLAGAHDMFLYAREGVRGLEWVQWGMLVIVLCQAVILSMRFSAAYDIVEQLVDRLQQKNRRLEDMNVAANRFVPEDMLQLLGKKDLTQVQLSDVVKTEMAVLFCDIRGFTTLSETMTPKENFEFVNEFLQRFGPVVHEHNGFVIKYLGDGLMAVFPEGVEDALRTSIQGLKEVREFNLSSEHEIRLGIGINYGSMMLGMMGEWNRLQGDVLSDAVNLGARVEGMTKLYNVELLMTETALNAIEYPEEFCIRELDRVKPKGKNIPVTVFEVFDADPDDKRERKLKTREALESSIHLYRQQEFKKAQQTLEQILEVFPEDRAVSLYIERCQRMLRSEETAHWDGVEVLQSK